MKEKYIYKFINNNNIVISLSDGSYNIFTLKLFRERKLKKIETTSCVSSLEVFLKHGPCPRFSTNN